ncbi:MAG: IPT/TIG domain-containing protein [Bacteroidota bacterium]
MKNKIFYFAACLLMLLGASALVTSCKDDEEGTSKIVLSSFGPSGIEHGQTLKFIGLNLDKVTAIELPGIEVQASAFTTRTSRLVELVVPEEAEAGLVVLKTPDGDITTKTALNFKVPVKITSITAEARPGAEISIKGTLVNWIEEIVFNDGISVTEFVSKSTTELKVKVPINAQSGILIFKSGGTDPESFASETELTVTLPAVTSLSPASVRHTENLTITGTDLDLVTSITFPGDKTVVAFESQSATEIVVKVPAGALKGKLVLKQASPVSVTTATDLIIILPVGTAVAPKPAKPGVDNLTITGTDLDLVKSLTLPASGVLEASGFISQSPTQIVFLVPDGTKSGGISYTTIHDYTSILGVTIIVPAPGPLPLNITMYDETPATGGGDWSWNKVDSDPASTEQFLSGDVSWKFSTTSGGGVSVGGMAPIDASSMDLFSFSVFGGPGTEGQQLAAILNDNWSDYNSVTLKEGQWTSYQIDLSKYPTTDLTKIIRFALKVESTSSTIYVDRVGFEPAGPPPLLVELYDEVLAPGGGDWSWNMVTSDKASTEQSYTGNVSWKLETSSTGGLSEGGITAIDVSAATHFTFALYGGTGTSGTVACILNDNWSDYNSVNVVEGQWTKFTIDLSKYPTTDLTKIVRFAFKVDNGSSSSIIYADRVGFD